MKVHSWSNEDRKEPPPPAPSVQVWSSNNVLHTPTEMSPTNTGRRSENLGQLTKEAASTGVNAVNAERGRITVASDKNNHDMNNV